MVLPSGPGKAVSPPPTGTMHRASMLVGVLMGRGTGPRADDAAPGGSPVPQAASSTVAASADTTPASLLICQD